MAMANLREIAERLQTAWALARYARRDRARGDEAAAGDARRDACDGSRRSRAQRNRAPAVVIVGEVVRLRDRLRWFDAHPLFGKRVLLTRARGDADDLAAQLWEAGAEPIVAPTIAITAPDDPIAGRPCGSRGSYFSVDRVHEPLRRRSVLRPAQRRGQRRPCAWRRFRRSDRAKDRRSAVTSRDPRRFRSAALRERRGRRRDCSTARCPTRASCCIARKRRGTFCPRCCVAEGRSVDVIAAYKTVVVHDAEIAPAAAAQTCGRSQARARCADFWKTSPMPRAWRGQDDRVHRPDHCRDSAGSRPVRRRRRGRVYVRRPLRRSQNGFRSKLRR